MELKPGYKKTEYGIFPEDWDLKPLGKLTSLLTNGFVGVATSHYVENEDGVLYIQGYNVEVNGFNFRGIKRVSYEFHSQHQKSCLQEGDLLTIQTGDVGVTAVVPSSLKGANCHALIITRFLKNTVISSFYSQFFNSERGCSIFKKIEIGTTMKHVNCGDMAQLILPVPPIEEQRSISVALSDVDALIAGLEKLIAKKRDLKQATMQQLLTGQTRLPGFSGEWEAVTLNEVCWFQEGPGVRNTQFTNSGVKLLNGTNIFRGSLNLDSTIRFISELEAYGPYAHFMAEEGDIVLASSGITIDRLNEKVSFVRAKDLPFCMNTSTIRFKPNPVCMAPMFLYQFLVSDDFKTQIGEVATGSAQLNFGPSHVEKVNIQIPCLDEQVEIGAVLSGMDNELTAMELRLAKTRDLKQGMMQELLTGRTRLV